MSRITKGQSTNDSVMYSTSKASIKVSFNGVVLFTEVNEVNSKAGQESNKAKKVLESINEKLNLRYGINAFFIFIFLIEVIDCCYFCQTNDKVVGISLALVVMMYAIYDMIVDGGKISRDKIFCQNHAAEHKVYNAYRNGLEITAKNAKESNMYSRKCGSVKMSNLLFLELINVIIILLTGIWIPNIIIVLFVFNYDNAIFNNVFCITFQHFLTQNPEDDSLFVALLAMKLVLKIDAIRDAGLEFTKDMLEILVYDTANEIFDENVLNISLEKYKQMRARS